MRAGALGAARAGEPEFVAHQRDSEIGFGDPVVDFGEGDFAVIRGEGAAGGGGEGGYESREAPPGARCGPCGREAGSR